MLITLIVCLCFGTNAHSENLEFSNSSASSSAPNTPPRISKEFCDNHNHDELAKISCMSASDHEKLWGGIVKHGLARVLNAVLIKEALFLIGKEELRKALNLPPPLPWASYNSTKPSDAEIASAPTIEAYFNLKEPNQKMHSLDSYYFFEHNFPPAIEFLDKRAPVIRTLFRCRFESILDAAGVTDRPAIDRMITEFSAIHTIVDRARQRMFGSECLDE